MKLMIHFSDKDEQWKAIFDLSQSCIFTVIKKSCFFHFLFKKLKFWLNKKLVFISYKFNNINIFIELPL